MSKKKFHLTFTFLVFLSSFAALPGFADEWNRVFLATYPRSGNHWMRYLIEEATHVATASVYCDPDPQHLNERFPWGGFCVDHGYDGNCRFPEKEDIIVIKTHFPFFKTKYDKLPAVKYIRIVRHPVDSIYSLYSYLHGGKPPETIIPTKNVQTFIRSWHKFQNHWNKQKNVYTLRYEDLFNQPYQALSKVLKAMGYNATHEDVERAIKKYPPEGKLLKHLDKYRHEDLVSISTQLHRLMKKFGYTIPGVD